MSLSMPLGGGETLFLTHLDLYNWGGFNERHTAEIDLAGTAVIGPTGSGKTTLVDALMTLLCANPRYNLASTGGHESDRDLVSYVRGVSGPGDGGDDQTHIARPGKTVTAFAARFANREKEVRLGAVLWFDGTSSSASDLRKLWLFAESPEQTLDHWLTVHHEGGKRALKQMEKETTGIRTYSSKKAYLARLRDYFEVGENAFTLLNRAAGLKQLNSIDEIFRELVLDDHSAFGRAVEVANSFDDLTDIHEELEIARRQQRSLVPVAEGWRDYQAQHELLTNSERLREVLPLWYAEQAHGLWKQREAELRKQQQRDHDAEQELESRLESQKQLVLARHQAYLQAGGGDIEQLELRIREKAEKRDEVAGYAKQYRHIAERLGMDASLEKSVFEGNQILARKQLEAMEQNAREAEEVAFETGVNEHAIRERKQRLEEEREAVLANPGSNVPLAFQQFRADLAEKLSLSESDMPFVAELIQIKSGENQWRGAIERAIGAHRLRILVPPEQIREALDWVNQRHNRLHVRLLEVKQPDRQPQFFEDGFTRKLQFKEHPFREALKALLAGIDRHCVADAEKLRDTPYAMTAQGLMSGKARHFDKQDQRRLDQDWMTGFDNRDRLASLEQDIEETDAGWRESKKALEAARARVGEVKSRMELLRSLAEVHFENIDLPGAERIVADLKQQFEILNDPNSDVGATKLALEEAEELCKRLEKEWRHAFERRSKGEERLEQARTSRQEAFVRMGEGLTGDQRQLGEENLAVPVIEDLHQIEKIEREALADLQKSIEQQNRRLTGLSEKLLKAMADAKHLDRGALSEAGRDLEDVPAYLERLQVLTEEALPEKQKRFKKYLNRSSDDEVTQLLTDIDNEVSMIEERLEDLNNTLRRVDFQPGRYLRLISKKVVHESLRTLQRALRELNSARFNEDDGESQYLALQHMVSLLRDACDRSRNQAAKALLDPRYRLEFAVSVIDRENGSVIETRTGSQGGSGGEKEIIASYVLTASLSYALCPDGSSRPLFGTIVLDEAFSRSSHAVAGRIIAALHEFGLHAVFITPNKEMRLLRNHTRSAIVVHRRGLRASLTSLSWEALDEFHQKKLKASDEIPG
ncbi:ATP-binding protein [Alloalcanivorax xenomutans]|uniref:ATP-binding protein n=1 Tax=Alloalcanivorax xenomutans TaxID=1094342 RepID=UPI0024E27262|nr:ATP-binding protein [Alloalcanivorax xenomutans]